MVRGRSEDRTSKPWKREVKTDVEFAVKHNGRCASSLAVIIPVGYKYARLRLVIQFYEKHHEYKYYV